ncbi:BamA/TamA family outer membrane protein, partial [Asaia sp. SF2.1]
YGYQYVPSYYVQDSAGWSLLSQLSTTLTYDRRDNRMRPRKGYVLNLSGDFAGVGGDVKYLRAKFDGQYYVPLDSVTGNHDWGLQFKGGVGYMGDWSKSSNVSIIDNFYLGGENLRGFLQGGAGPRTGHTSIDNPLPGQEDLIGGRFIYTASAQLNFPLPMGEDVGISGRYFVDAGSLAGLRVKNLYTNPTQAKYTPVTGNTLTPRVTTGLGISWKSPFGLVNIDAAVPIRKSRNDRLYPIRFGFGQQF